MELSTDGAGGNGQQLVIANTFLTRNNATVNEHSFPAAVDRICKVRVLGTSVMGSKEKFQANNRTCGWSVNPALRQ